MGKSMLGWLLAMGLIGYNMFYLKERNGNDTSYRTRFGSMMRVNQFFFLTPFLTPKICFWRNLLNKNARERKRREYPDFWQSRLPKLHNARKKSG
jgi:hypothetical protein